MKHSLASEKKYSPERKRKGKRSGGGDATAEGEQEADQTTNLLEDNINTTAASSVPN